MLMAVLSKIQFLPLSDILGTSSCQQVVHNWTSSCTLATLDTFFLSLRGWSMFFFPIYLILAKWRRLTLISLLKDVKNYFRSVCFGTILCTNIIACFCLVRKLIGGYKICLSLLIPTAIGATSIFIEQKRRKIFLATYFSAMTMECIVSWLEQNDLLHISKTKYTLIFMCVNAMLMHLYRYERKIGNSEDNTIMWFFQPPYHSQLSKVMNGTAENGEVRRNNKTENINDTNTCPHEGPCWKFIQKCTSKYAAVGLAFQLVRTFVLNFKKLVRSPRMLVSFLINKHNFRLSVFLGGYVLVYWVTHCLLCRRWNNTSISIPIISGFLSGIFYYIYPQHTIFFYALSTMISLLFRYCVHAELLPSITHADCWVFILCTVFLVHSYAFFGSASPQAFKTMINIGSSGRFHQVFKHFDNVVKQYYSNLQHTGGK